MALIKLLLLRRLSRAAFTASSSLPKSRLLSPSYSRYLYLLEASNCAPERSISYYASRNFCFPPSSSNIHDDELSQGPAPIDYSSILHEDEFHKLADSTIQELLEKMEEYGDTVDIDGFDIDYGNHVLTVKLGNLGTYVLNKQTPNRQIWMSSPLSGPSRFDWDQNAKAWIYRRNKANLSKLLEVELEKLCGKGIRLS